jgi:transcriptional regulator with XRE-family HTH domain
MNQNKIKLGAQLKAARKEKKLTQLNVAHLVGCQEAAVSKIEKGQDGGLPLLLLLMDLYEIKFSESIFVAKVDADADVPRIIERKKKT